MTVARINGVDVYYRVEGEGERLILTHGAWTDSDTWIELTKRMADRFQVVRWDRRGHSRSHGDPGTGDYSEDVADLIALNDHLGGGPAHMVGNSSGGEIVLLLMESQPDLVASAAVHEPGLFGPCRVLEPRLVEDEERACEQVLDLIDAGESSAAVKTFIERVLGEGAWEMTPSDFRERFVANASTFPAEARAAFHPDPIDLARVAASRRPLLVTLGTDSGELERVATRLVAGRVPGSRLQELEGTGHIPHRSHPDQYAEVLIDFYDSIGAGMLEVTS